MQLIHFLTIHHKEEKREIFRTMMIEEDEIAYRASSDSHRISYCHGSHYLFDIDTLICIV